MRKWEKNYWLVIILISIADIAGGIFVMKRGQYGSMSRFSTS
ncbi:MAG: hypothetical protein UDC06_00500 [Lachnospiraceae bacterium]|nr:hypothetical protein [Lachnospiraceae bacterium]